MAGNSYSTEFVSGVFSHTEKMRVSSRMKILLNIAQKNDNQFESKTAIIFNQGSVKMFSTSYFWKIDPTPNPRFSIIDSKNLGLGLGSWYRRLILSYEDWKSKIGYKWMSFQIFNNILLSALGVNSYQHFFHKRNEMTDFR